MPWRRPAPDRNGCLSTDFASAAAGPMQDVSLGAREELLPLLTPEVVEVALRRMDCGTFAVIDRGWQVSLAPVGGSGLPFPDGRRRQRDGL